MRTRKIKSIYHKEMLDLFRDKKTLIMMVLVPLVIYPLIMVATLLITSSITKNIQNGTYQVAVIADDTMQKEYSDLVPFLETKSENQTYSLKVVETSSAEDALQEKQIDAYVIVHPSAEKIAFEIKYLSAVTNSSAASDMLSSKIKAYGEQLSAQRLSDLKLDADSYLHPVDISYSDLSGKEKSIGNMLGMILPFLLITSILMGAFYPAIDTTTGEKERGTLETLLTLPLRNDELIVGKFLAVATISVISSLLNLVSMAFISLFLYETMNISDKSGEAIHLAEFIPALMIVLLCVVAFAMFISAITMCVTAFAKSFKEANNYTTPLLLIIMLTGYISFIPNVELTPLMAAIPVVNICLLISKLLVFEYSLSIILIVLTTNIAYAAIAILILSKIYNSEDILFGEGGISLQIFSARCNLPGGGVPNFSDAILVSAISVLLLLYAGTLLQLKFPFMGIFYTQLLIIGTPLLFAWYTKKDFRKTFSLRVPSLPGVLGAILLEIGAYALITLLSVPLTILWPQDAQAVSETFANALSGIPFFYALLVLALVPAICEETLFRGYLFSAAAGKFKPFTAIMLVAGAFGIYHFSLVKFFTTGLLGLALCYATYRSGSIFLSCLMHFLNNAFAVILLYREDTMSRILPVFFKEELVPADAFGLLITGLICVPAGIFLIGRFSRKEVTHG